MPWELLNVSGQITHTAQPEAMAGAKVCLSLSSHNLRVAAPKRGSSLSCGHLLQTSDRSVFSSEHQRLDQILQLQN